MNFNEDQLKTIKRSLVCLRNETLEFQHQDVMGACEQNINDELDKIYLLVDVVQGDVGEHGDGEVVCEGL